MRRQRAGPAGSACLSELMGQEGAGRAPVAKDGCLRDTEHLAGLAHVEPAKEPALDEERLARLELGERLEGTVKREELLGTRGRRQRVLVKRHQRSAATALPGRTATCGLHQYLPHGARCDALEVCGRGGGEVG